MKNCLQYNSTFLQIMPCFKKYHISTTCKNSFNFNNALNCLFIFLFRSDNIDILSSISGNVRLVEMFQILNAISNTFGTWYTNISLNTWVMRFTCKIIISAKRLCVGKIIPLNLTSWIYWGSLSSELCLFWAGQIYTLYSTQT